MNYITEINGFYQRQETNPLSANAANLWHTLMHVNNRAGWQKKFTVAVAVLCCKANLSNSTFKRARKELREKGYIYVESQGGNRAAIYRMIASETSQMKQNDSDKNEANDDHVEPKNKIPSKSSLKMDQNMEMKDHNTGHHVEPETNLSPKTSTHLDHNVAPLYKQNKTKQKRSTAATEGVTFFRENIGKVQPYIEQGITKWVGRLGEPLVLTAMKRALDRGKSSWGYIKAILKSWLDKGFRTVTDTEWEVDAFSQKRKKKTSQAYKPAARKPVTREVILDWFYNRDEKQPKSKSDTAAVATERAELSQLIAAFAGG